MHSLKIEVCLEYSSMIRISNKNKMILATINIRITFRQKYVIRNIIWIYKKEMKNTKNFYEYDCFYFSFHFI